MKSKSAGSLNLYDLQGAIWFRGKNGEQQMGVLTYVFHKGEEVLITIKSIDHHDTGHLGLEEHTLGHYHPVKVFENEEA